MTKYRLLLAISSKAELINLVSGISGTVISSINIVKKPIFYYAEGEKDLNLLANVELYLSSKVFQQLNSYLKEETRNYHLIAIKNKGL